MPTENDLFQLWLESDAGGRPDIENELYARTLRHARALIKINLREQNDDLAARMAGIAITRLTRFRRECDFSTWLHGIAIKQIKLELRGRVRRRRVFDETIDVSDETAFPSPQATEQSGVEARLDSEQVKRELTPDDARLWVGMLEGKDQNELAKDLGITPRAAETRRRRLRAKVKNILPR